MGKSRLATAAAELAEQSGRPVLALIGSPFHADAGLHPIRTLLEQRAGIERTTAQSDRLRLLEDGGAVDSAGEAVRRRYLDAHTPQLALQRLTALYASLQAG